VKKKGNGETKGDTGNGNQAALAGFMSNIKKTEVAGACPIKKSKGDGSSRLFEIALSRLACRGGGGA